MTGAPPTRSERQANRSASISAHIRRCCDALEWLDREKGDAEVLLDGRRIGTWSGIDASRSLTAGRLRIAFLSGNRRLVATVLSFRTDLNSVSFTLSGTRRNNVVRVEWGQSDDCIPHSPESFDTAVLTWAFRAFPRSTIVGDDRRSRLGDSLSGAFRRLTLRNGGSLVHVLVAGPAETGEPADPLTQALLWLSSTSAPLPARLVMLVPARSGRILAGRARFLDPEKVRAEIRVYGPDDSMLENTTRPPLPVPPEEGLDYRWPILGDYRWSPLLGRVLDLAPRSIRRHPRFTDSDSLRIMGLEFARVCGVDRDRIEFGVGPAKTELSEANFDQLARLVEEILYFRRADSPDTSHLLYRAQSERWLESMVLDEVDRLFPELQPASVYSQIPVYLSGEAGRADVIGVDREGTLVVLELKVLADPGLPLQAMDYRARVDEHNRRGDFDSRGYFAGTGLARRPARALLVAPVFEFHDSTERIARYFDSGIELWKIGINEDWRGGVKILLKRRVGPAEGPGHDRAGRPKSACPLRMSTTAAASRPCRRTPARPSSRS